MFRNAKTCIDIFIFFVFLECPTGWYFIRGNCYLFKKVDKREAKLIQDCPDNSCLKPVDEKNPDDLKSKLPLLSTTTQSTSTNSDLDVETTSVASEDVSK